MDLKQTILNLYKEDSSKFYKSVINLLLDIANKYTDTSKIYSSNDLTYINDLLLIRLLDTSFDKQMEQDIKLDFKFNSIETLKALSSKSNILLLQFSNKPLEFSKVIENLHIYLTLLQEELNLRSDLNIDNIKNEIKNL